MQHSTFLLALLVLIATSASAEINATYRSLLTNFLEDSSEEQGEEDAVTAACRQSGGERAVSSLEVVEQRLTECFNNKTNVEELRVEAEGLSNRSLNGVLSFYMKYCSLIPEVVGCSRSEVRAAGELCLDKHHSNLLDIAIEIGLEVANYSCVHESFRWLMTPAGYTCLFTSDGDLKNCTPPTLLNTIGSQNFTSLVFDEHQCRELDASLTCVLRYMQDCQENLPATHMMAIFNIVRAAVPCHLEQLSQRDFQETEE